MPEYQVVFKPIVEDLYIIVKAETPEEAVKKACRRVGNLSKYQLDGVGVEDNGSGMLEPWYEFMGYCSQCDRPLFDHAKIEDWPWNYHTDFDANPHDPPTYCYPCAKVRGKIPDQITVKEHEAA